MVDGWLVFFGLLAAYAGLVFILGRAGVFHRGTMTLFLGFILMIKTRRGQGLLNRLARARRFWDRSAHIGLYVTGLAMVLMTLLLIVQVPFILQLPAEAAPSPSLILGIPGINPIIPVGFGIIALIFAVVVHELSHGVMARVYDLKVKTMGILFFIVPIGAFVEPDDDELKATTRTKRARVFSAGPLSNLVFAILFAAIFSGLMVGATQPVAGIPIQAIEADGPANASGLQPGWIITHVDGQAVPCLDDLQAVMGNTTTDVRPNATITLRLLETADGPAREVLVTTARRADLFASPEAADFYQRNPDIADQTVIGFRPYPHCQVHELLGHPFTSGRSALAYLGLPFLALSGQFPLSAPFNEYFVVADGWNPTVFWALVSLLFWLFWIDLMLGLTNALPLVPLDGGHMFRDFIDWWVERAKPHLSAAERAPTVNRAAAFMAFFLLGLILLQFVGPPIAAIFR